MTGPLPPGARRIDPEAEAARLARERVAPSPEHGWRDRVAHLVSEGRLSAMDARFLLFGPLPEPPS